MILINKKKIWLYSIIGLAFTSVSLQSTSFKLYTMQPIYSEGDPIPNRLQAKNYPSNGQHQLEKNIAIRVAIPTHTYKTKNKLSETASKESIKNGVSSVKKLKIISSSLQEKGKVATQNPTTIIPNYISYNHSFSRNYVSSVNAGIPTSQQQQAVAYRSSIPLEGGRKMLKPIYSYDN
jgi:hypothetical protein